MNNLVSCKNFIVSDLLKNAVDRLRKTSDTPYLDAQILLSDTLKMNRARLIANLDLIIDEEHSLGFSSLVSRRATSEPIAYILNQKEFYSRTFYIDHTVLVPRPETEHIVECAINFLRHKRMPKVLEIATGSGIIAVTLKKECPQFDVTASDISLSALAIARKNAKALGAEINFIQSDIFKSISDRYDLIIANPPYVETELIDSSVELKHEPRLALDGGKDGMYILNQIIKEANQYLNKDGCLLLEHGNEQFEALEIIGYSHNFKLRDIVYDLQSYKRGTLFSGQYS